MVGGHHAPCELARVAPVKQDLCSGWWTGPESFTPPQDFRQASDLLSGVILGDDQSSANEELPRVTRQHRPIGSGPVPAVFPAGLPVPTVAGEAACEFDRMKRTVTECNH